MYVEGVRLKMDPTLFTRLQQEYNKTPQDLTQIDSLLRSAMIQLSTAGIGAGDDSKSSGVDKQQIQQVLEMGAFWSIHSKNQTSFERYCSLLFPIYFDSKNSTSSVPNNAPMYTVLGLHLLNLLVSNRVADFYVALERINAAPGVDASNVFIQFPIQLQQCLVEGTFHRVVMARQQVPSPEYAWFIDGLMDTIRNELANCLEKSFETIDLASAAKLLLLTPEQIPQLVSFAQQRGWNMDSQKNLVFGSKKPKSDDVPTFARELILQSLGYARDLEKII